MRGLMYIVTSLSLFGCSANVKTIVSHPAETLCLSMGGCFEDVRVKCAKYFQSKKYDLAFLACEQAAEDGDAWSQYRLGLIYLDENSGKKDTQKAIEWLHRAAEQGHSGAAYTLGVLYSSGQENKPNYSEAARWLRVAAKGDLPEAMMALGWMYANGKGVRKDRAIAAEWFYKAGVTFFNRGERDRTLECAEKIRDLGGIPNAFLRDELMSMLYGEKNVAKMHQNQGGGGAQISLGTGWVVKGGYIVTNHHVIEGHKEIILIRKDGIKLRASVVADDPANDLVLLKPESIESLPLALPLAEKPARVGEHVFTIGYPLLPIMGVEPKVTDGIISSRTGIGNDPRFYQISVPLQSGNSGGPLLNMRGEVVGVVSAKIDAVRVFKWTGEIPENVSYAVKTLYVRALLSSVPAEDYNHVPIHPRKAGGLEELVRRVGKSVILIMGK